MSTSQTELKLPMLVASSARILDLIDLNERKMPLSRTMLKELYVLRYGEENAISDAAIRRICCYLSRAGLICEQEGGEMIFTTERGQMALTWCQESRSKFFST